MYWLHVPNTIIGTPILLNGRGPIMRCDSGSQNMQLEFRASFDARNTRTSDLAHDRRWWLAGHTSQVESRYRGRNGGTLSNSVVRHQAQILKHLRVYTANIGTDAGKEHMVYLGTLR